MIRLHLVELGVFLLERDAGADPTLLLRLSIRPQKSCRGLTGSLFVSIGWRGQAIIAVRPYQLIEYGSFSRPFATLDSVSFGCYALAARNSSSINHMPLTKVVRLRLVLPPAQSFLNERQPIRFASRADGPYLLQPISGQSRPVPYPHHNETRHFFLSIHRSYLLLP